MLGAPPWSSASSEALVMSERAFRLRFSFDGKHIHLVHREILRKRAPSTDWAQAHGRSKTFRPRTGFWIELRDAAGAAVYRRLLPDPIQQYPETPDEHDGWTRTFVRSKEAIFSVLVPVMREARSVTIIGPPSLVRASSAQSRDLASFSLN
jgi:hypothetical protein